MSKTKKWQMLYQEENISPDQIEVKGKEVSLEKIIKILLKNRGLTTKKEIDEFLDADLRSVTPKSVGIDRTQLAKSVKRIQKAVTDKEQIVVFGDYDVDGITGTAILWETLYGMKATVIPYIPSRIEEGYGLSIPGVNNVILNLFQDLKKISGQARNDRGGLIITVDNGIVANEAVDFANQQGIDVIVTDHHTVGEKLPKAFSIFHTTKVCGAAVAWLLSQAVISHQSPVSSDQRPKTKDQRLKTSDHLALVALATVADLVPLVGANRTLLRFGLAELKNTSRPGLQELFKEAKIEAENIGVYEIGHIIAPRLNAMGRLESAMDSLRLLCTKDRLRAKVLADTLQRTNKERQLLTQSASLHAIENFRGKKLKKILFIAHDQYEEGIIGLVAGRLVEEFYLPAIVLSKGETLSKASARSIGGFNIIEFIRTSSHLLVNAGGHPMAAGFTIETKNIDELQKVLEALAEEAIDGEMLTRILKIDCEIPLDMITQNFYAKLLELSPFGMGNPEPTFVSKAVVEDIRTVGAEKQHLKLKITNPKPQNTNKSQYSKSKNLEFGTRNFVLEAIAFNMGDKAKELRSGQEIDIVYTISENKWNGKTSIQLKVKDIKLSR